MVYSATLSISGYVTLLSGAMVVLKAKGSGSGTVDGNGGTDNGA